MKGKNNYCKTYGNGVPNLCKNILTEHKNTTKHNTNKHCESKTVSEKKTPCEQNSKKTLGKIKVVATLEKIGGEPLKGVKINLYVTNGVSPKLVRSIISDCNGEVIFNNLEYGNYRVIEIIDKKCFEKPQYKRWNEVNIDNSNNYEEVYIINKIKET